MSTEDTEKKGPSKKELKKMAKKAEKQAKKQQAAAAKADADDTAPSKAPPPRKPVVLYLANANDSPCSWKVIWASQLYGVSLQPTYQSYTPLPHGPSLVYGDQVVFGGNSMAKSMCWYAGDKISPEVDEWCEWERTVLRHNIQQGLPKLEQALQECGGHHLVHHTTTVADIVVVSTLAAAASKEQSYSKIIQDYLHCHEHALQQAQESVESLQLAVDTSNPSLVRVLQNVFKGALEKLFGSDAIQNLPPNFVTKCVSSKHGDYQCNAAMPLFAVLKKSGNVDVKSPQDVAQRIIKEIGTHNAVVTDLQMNGPGFVLCRLTTWFLQAHVNHLVQTGHLPKPQCTPQVCLVDFSSPNIAKEMHVGHLRSTILGEAICRILEYAGNTVLRINHVGDWGTQFGMLIQYLKEEYPDFTSSTPNITDLTAFYKSAKQKFDEDEAFKEASRINVVKLQSGDEDCLHVWKILCDVSRMEFQKVYDRLDITVEECGESFYNDEIPPVIEEFEAANLIQVQEGGAKCVFVENYKIPLMLQKSDGGYGYDSTDMAALKYRLHDLKATRIICVTDYSQGDHFAMCFKAAHDIGWVDNNQKLQHIGFGTVMGEDGKRFKTRSGDTVRLVDLLDEAVGRMEASLKERIADEKLTVNISLEEVHPVAEAIGYGAVKYFDLRRNPTSNYKFSYDQMLDTKGNTAVYLLYANARLESIITKAKTDYNVDVDELIAKKTEIVIGHSSERNLCLQLQTFTDSIELTLDDLFPYHICDYVYNVAVAAADFVTQCKVLGSPEMSSRLLLCRATTMAMRECFDLLGIRHVDRI